MKHSVRSASPAIDQVWIGYGLAFLVTSVATGINALMQRHVAQTNLVMVYLLGVAFVASSCKPGPAIFASVLGVASFDFFFVHPIGTFAVADIEYVFTFGVMLVVSLLISTLTMRLREQSLARNEATLNAEVEQLRSTLLSSVSHDLRTPLASIEGSAGALLQQPEIAPQSRQLAVTMQEESVRMARLIDNLLDMMRVQGQVDLNLDWYGLDELVSNAILQTEPLFSHPVRMDFAPDTPLVRVDGVLIEQAFVNLLENAAKYGGADVNVIVRIAVIGRTVRASVSDDGPGIEPGHEEQIFERFHGSSSRGFGLGLSICKAAVEAHGGRIFTEPMPRGASFVVELPISEVTEPC